jgi:F-type H+-transporting ATPase subunit delta
MSQSQSNLHSTVLDSDAQQVGSLYGKALLGAAGGDVDQLVDQLNSIVRDCLSKQPALEQILSSPRVNQVDKEQLIDRIFGGRVHSTLLNFLKVLCRRGRIGWLRGIQVSAQELREQQLGLVRATVRTALPLDEQQRQAIAQRLGQTLGHQVVLDEQVDPSLLGGIMIRVGDQVYDGSVEGKMSALRSAVNQGIQKAVRDRFATLLTS